MIEVGVTSLAKRFADEPVLRDVSFDLQTGQRLGMVGANGCGKTTIFRIICGMDAADSGAVALRKGCTLGYLQQVPQIADAHSAGEVVMQAFDQLKELQEQLRKLDAILTTAHQEQLPELMETYGQVQSRFEQAGGYHIEVEAAKICTGLNLPDAMLARPFAQLSGGEKTRVLLARILLEAPDVLLLDEPTNHLDIASVEWLEGFLAEYPGAALIISHDRYFLDKTVTGIVEIEAGSATRYTGNYTAYQAEKERRLLAEFENYKNIQKKIKAMKAAAERFRIWGRINTDNNAHMARAKRLEAKIAELQEIDKPRQQATINANFEAAGRSGKEVLKAKGVSKRYGTKVLLKDADFLLQYGQRIAFLGPNGSGKTTFLRMLMGDEMPDAGQLLLGSRVKPGLLEQEVQFADPTATVLDTFRNEYPMHEGPARNILAEFLFRRDDVFKQISALSGGEKVRLRLCLMMQSEINLLLLDEPTNHLDIQSKEVMEEALKNFAGTIFFISHDRYFINRLASGILALEETSLNYYDGNYDYYRRHCSSAQSKPASPPAKKEQCKPAEKKTNSWRINQLEEEIARQEEETHRIQSAMEEHGSDYEKLMELQAHLHLVQSQLDELMKQWEEAMQ